MKISARDVYGGFLPWAFSVRVTDTTTDRDQFARDVPPRGRAEFETNPTRLYRVRVECDKHATVQRMVSKPVGLLMVKVPVLPGKVSDFKWPQESPSIPGVEWDEIADSIRRGALLNIWAKMKAVTLAGSPVTTFVDEVQEVRPDRILCEVRPSILASLQLAIAEQSVSEVTSAVGHEPPPDYKNGVSVKTLDDYGNLQISIMEPDGYALRGGVDDPLLADVDIDEAQGVEHFLDVIQHHATRTTTNQVEIHQILVAQGIDPGWRPLVT